jgi:putative ABC transport system permease protein
VIGVVGDWNPQPHFYDLDEGAYGKADQMYLPFFSWLELPQDYGYGPMRCWGNDPNAGQHDPKATQCTWAQFWVQLNTPVEVASYHSMLDQYSVDQHQLGRFQRSPNVRLRALMDWLDYKHVIPVMVRMQTWIAFGVFLICMLNTIGLLVAKFIRKSGEIGVRRALGASRRDVFVQCLVEAGVIGVVGGLGGLPLAWLGLWIVRQQPVTYAASAHLQGSTLLMALTLALLATLFAGMWPAWRAARIAPGLQVKTL